MNIFSNKRFIFTIVFSLFFVSLSVFSQERILSFASTIDIQKDSSLIVTETIKVRAEGDEIRRGIYRDFPVKYTNSVGFIVRTVGFEVLDVKRDGEPEKWRAQGRGNDVRIYIGDKNTLLQQADYTYTLRYKTTNQLGFFNKYDELYWNVTGNGWSFPIDKASAQVNLPIFTMENAFGANSSPINIDPNKITMEGYTGQQGSKEQAYTATILNDGAIIKTTENLEIGEGLTLVMTWPKGLITQPAQTPFWPIFWHNNLLSVMSLTTLVLIFIFLYRTWSQAGRDPKSGVIFPHYNPPKGYSPAASRYISEMHYDNDTLTAAIINLAVKGYVSIKKVADDYVLIKQSSDQPLAPGEKLLIAHFFESREKLELTRDNRIKIYNAMKEHEEALEKDYHNIYFSRNSGKLWRSGFLVFAIFIVTAITGAVTNSPIGPFFIPSYFLIIILYIAFKLNMKAPSKKGRLLMDKLEGFKKYLEVAEIDDLNLRNPPEKTPELFERYLPFAIALGVQHNWANQFTKVFSSLDFNNTGYHPDWYDGDFHGSDINNFTTDISNGMSTAISSASVDSSTGSGSSGSDGGGSSGGGGGGGGGGGW